MKKLVRTGFRIVATAILLALSVALAATLVEVPVVIGSRRGAMALSGGFAAGLLLFGLVCRFSPAYVFGHELTHLVVAKLFRRRTGRFRLSGSRGSVEIERPNIAITLAPYFVPFYAVAWLGLYGAFCLFASREQTIPGLVHAGLGLAYAYHVVLTLYALRRGQADLAQYGPVLSLAVILAANLLLLVLAATVISGDWKLTAATFVTHLQLEWAVLRRVSLWILSARLAAPSAG